MRATSGAHGTRLYRVVGNSMFPRVRLDDLALCREKDETLRWGDIGVFKVGSKLVIHRVVAPRRHMGDHELKLRPFRRQEVVGRVITLQRGTTRLDLETTASRARGRVLAIRGLSRLAARRLRRFAGRHPQSGLAR